MTRPDTAKGAVAGADVLVVGGGVAGATAAIAAARLGAKVTLLERYGRLGGMATGGLVLLWDDMADATHPTVAGIVTEVLDRLHATGGAVLPPAEVRFTNAERNIRAWAGWGFEDLYSRMKPKMLTYAASVDPESLAFVLAQMATEAGVHVQLNTAFADIVRDGATLTGVHVTSKRGQSRLEGSIVIDASGDGDVFAAAGAPHVEGSYLMTLTHRLASVDVEGHLRWADEHAEEARLLNRRMRDFYGGSWNSWWLRTPLEGVVWCNCPHFPSLDGLSPDDQTRVILEGRRRIHDAVAFARANIPGFERAVLIDTASQVGVRQTRLLRGEYVLTKEDVSLGRWFDDRIGRGRDYFYPYRSLLPLGVEGLIVAGRCFSATPEAQRVSREIPPLMTVGQAAGTAAALALETGVRLREVDVPTLQDRLRAAGADLGPDADPGPVRTKAEPFTPPVPMLDASL